MESTITESTKNHKEKSKLIRKNKNQLRNKMENINDTITETNLKSTITESTKNNFVPENRKKSNDNLKMSVLKEKYPAKSNKYQRFLQKS